MHQIWTSMVVLVKWWLCWCCIEVIFTSYLLNVFTSWHLVWRILPSFVFTHYLYSCELLIIIVLEGYDPSLLMLQVSGLYSSRSFSGIAVLLWCVCHSSALPSWTLHSYVCSPHGSQEAKRQEKMETFYILSYIYQVTYFPPARSHLWI